MELEIIDTGKAIRLRIRGELDAVSAPELRDALEAVSDEAPKQVELDLSELELIDSSGVGAIVGLFKRLRSHGGDLTVRGLRGQPRSIFQLLRLDRVFELL